MFKKLTTYSYNFLPIASMIVSLYTIRLELNSSSPRTLVIILLVGTFVLILFSFIYITNQFFAPRFSYNIIKSAKLSELLNRFVIEVSELSVIKNKNAKVMYLDIMAPFTAYQLKKLSINSHISWRTGKPNIIETFSSKQEWLLKVVKTLPMTNGYTAIPVFVGSEKYFGASEAYLNSSIRYIPNVLDAYENWMSSINTNTNVKYEGLNYKRDKSNYVESILCIPLTKSKCILNVVIDKKNIWTTFKESGRTTTILKDIDSKYILDEIGSLVDYIDYVCLSFLNKE